MPAPIILQDQSGLAQGIAGAGSALAGALQQRGTQHRQQAGLSTFQQAMETGDLSDPQVLSSAYQQALQAGADPAQLQFLGQQWQQAKEQKAFSSAWDESMNFGGMQTQEGQDAFMRKYMQGGGDPFKAIQMFKKDKKGENTFDKKINEFKADSVINYMQGGDDASRNLKENLDYLETNIKNVGRLKGAATGEFLTEGAGFTEYRNRGNLVLDGVIKVFNKAGVLPQKKLEWILKTFAISPWDTQEQIKGKINSLRTLEKEASSFSSGMGKLIDQYGQNIPNEAFMNLQKRAASVLDKFGEAVESPQGEQVVSKLTNKGYKKGDEAVNSKTGQKYIFSGTRWIKKK